MSSIIAINGGTLIDGNGGDPEKDSVLLVQDDRIIKVGRQDEVMIPPDARVIDASGKTVMPGLIESHSHPLGERGSQSGIWKYMDNIMNSPLLPYFKAVEVLRILIRKGITTIRILHPTIPSAPELKGEHLVALRTAVERGYFPSPRVLAAGCVIPSGGHLQSMTKPHLLNPGWVGQDGPWEVRKRVRECLLQDVDVIKLLGPTGGGGIGPDGPKVQGMNYEEVVAAVEEAHWKNIPVSAHAHGGPGLRITVEAGIDTLEHGTYLHEEPDLLPLMKEKGIIFVPTMGMRFHEGFMKYESALAGKLDPTQTKKILDSAESSKKSIKAAHKAGVTIAAGTDLMRWDFNPLAWEIYIYVREGGLTPMEALVTATKNAAKACNLPDVGTLEEGKIADILVVDGDPLNDITVLQDEDRIRYVLKDGKIQVDDGRINW